MKLFVLGLIVFILAGCRADAGDTPPDAPPSAAARADSTASTEEEHPEWEKHFDAYGAEGTFVVYDEARDRFLRYNPARSRQRFIPASTFKIFNSLVALETGVVADTNEVIPWDGVERWAKSWNRDHNLQSAFRNSAYWFYQEIARRVGEERMQEYVSREHYGNENLSGGIDRFWLEGGLRISANEQVELLRKLRAGTLGFSPRTMALVREMMVMERADDYVLRGKTGWAEMDSTSYGWLVGWLERGDDAYFYALQLESRDPDFPMWESRPAITFAILDELGLRPKDGPAD